ncbi:hypothetical protein ACFFQW_28960 [Umezawaea endophytica]|uniref:Uncharacterized protein n=1 Tax=Umezawaea endophytica TaxID=1654476 RepID=A0A9X2VXC7_9PSEU|nr:hypothetical protein [Umezawaea endophytica]MCS7484137.1 hypothetical protein [Umezawaea endophytica]
MGTDERQRHSVTVKNSGEAHASEGGVAVTGVVHGDVIVRTPVASSAYRHQILRIAPTELIGREVELEELASFCTAQDQKSYIWWRARAWSGKTALMAWFALHPPQSVTIVSFFITARFAGQSDRAAFTDVVGEQLAALLGQPMPAYLTEATREGHLLAMLNQAAEWHQQRGQRLVLLVDGLDEDRGVTTGPDAYNIAALLPAHATFGLRMIVAGRPDPPIPADVPDHHPLRDPGIVRNLARSPYAATVRADCERELLRLMRGTPEEKDLLGLVAAAGGGLTTVDLADLTGYGEWEIAQNLAAVAGRTFTVRAGRASLSEPTVETHKVYVLGHEELQETALAVIGRVKVLSYREMLHRWADEYQAQGWPENTPEYLLYGYSRLLQSIGGLSRSVACATDSARQNRLREATGGDAAALAEIEHAAVVVFENEDLDLDAMVLLAAHRQRLVERNAYPASLPAVWAAVGQPDRAEALARSMGDTHLVCAALAEIAVEVGADDQERAARLADIVEHLGDDSYEAVSQARRAAHVARATGAAGNLTRAAALECAIGDLLPQADHHYKLEVLAAQAQAAAASGNRRRASELAEFIEDVARERNVGRLGFDVKRAAESKDPERISVALSMLRRLVPMTSPSLDRVSVEGILTLAAEARPGKHGDELFAASALIERFSEPPFWMMEEMGPLVVSAIAACDVPRLTRLIDAIERSAIDSIHPAWGDAARFNALIHAVTEGLGTCGDRARAASLSQTLGAAYESAVAEGDKPGEAFSLLVATLGAAAVAGHHSRADALLARVPADYRTEAIALMSRAALGHGDRERAAALAAAAERNSRDNAFPGSRAFILAELAIDAADAGDSGTAALLAQELERLNRGTVVHEWKADVQRCQVKVLVASGEEGLAETAARAIAIPWLRRRATEEIMRGLGSRGAYARAEAYLLGLSERQDRFEAAADLASTAIDRRAFGWAQKLVGMFPTIRGRAKLWTALAGVAAFGGAEYRAAEMLSSLQELARLFWYTPQREELKRYLAESLTWNHCFDSADELVRSIDEPYWRETAIIAMINAAMKLGRPHLAATWSREALRMMPADQRERSRWLSSLAEAALETGDLTMALAFQSTSPYRMRELKP